ncbi:exonuclease domain-containing protein [Celerinatantimonas sp. YJH-8]|uniref:3'-5' exonuclease n=1 Tax=Celerinatantimonas sp. YJH-8 TaxID=3228714 RepID=UPI0038BF60E8
MGYLNQLFEPKSHNDKQPAALIKRSPQLLSEPGLREWLKASLSIDEQKILTMQNYLAVDIETSGLDPNTDALLSIGFVPIDRGRINLAQAQHYYIRDASHINANSAVINHIVPQMLLEGLPAKEVLQIFFKNLAGRIPIAHGSWIEHRFIEHQAQQTLGLPYLPLQWLDTLKIEKSRMANGCVPPNLDVQLNSVRHRYNLPDYQAHNALYDAIATAELFLVLTRAIYGNNQPSLQNFYKYQQKARMNL